MKRAALRAALAVVAAAVVAAAGAAHDVRAAAPCPHEEAGLRRWTALSALPQSSAPTRNVQLPAGTAVLYDVPGTLALRSLTIPFGSRLVFADDGAKRELRARFVRVLGEMWAGAPHCPFTSSLTFTLVGARPATESLETQCGGKAICVSEPAPVAAQRGARLELHGAHARPTWTRLAARADHNATVLRVRDALDAAAWHAGAEVVVTSTDFPTPSDGVQHVAVGSPLRGADAAWMGANEQRRIVAVRDGGHELEVAPPLLFAHFGIDPAAAAAAAAAGHDVDEAGEVALLTRNIVVRGDEAEAERDEFGATVMCHRHGIMHISYVELHHAGQARLLGRYPVHAHLMRNQTDLTELRPGADLPARSYARGVAVHRSYSRAFTIHGTQHFELRDNVAFDGIGALYFIEDGAERKNTLIHNIGIAPRPGTLLPGDDGVGPTVFWITNPDNTFVDNVAVGGRSGYWFILPSVPLGPSKLIWPSVRPRNTKLLKFENNSAHSGHNGLLADRNINADGSIVNARGGWRSKGLSNIKNFLAFKCSARCVWAITVSVMFEDNHLADCPIGFEIGSTNDYTDGGVYVGYPTLNRGSELLYAVNDTRTRVFKLSSVVKIRRTAVKFYDHHGPTVIRNLLCGETYVDPLTVTGSKAAPAAGCYSGISCAGNVNGPIYSVLGAKFAAPAAGSPPTTRVWWDDCGGSPGQAELSYSFADLDGSVSGTGVPRQVVVRNPFFDGDDGCVDRPDWNGKHCGGIFAKLSLSLHDLGVLPPAVLPGVSDAWAPRASRVVPSMLAPTDAGYREEKYHGEAFTFMLMSDTRGAVQRLGTYIKNVGHGLYGATPRWGHNWVPQPRSGTQTIMLANDTYWLLLQHPSPPRVSWEYEYVASKKDTSELLLPYADLSQSRSGAAVSVWIMNGDNAGANFTRVADGPTDMAAPPPPPLSHREYRWEPLYGALRVHVDTQHSYSTRFSGIFSDGFELDAPLQLGGSGGTRRTHVQMKCAGGVARCCDDATGTPLPDGRNCGRGGTCIRGTCGGAPMLPAAAKGAPLPPGGFGFGGAQLSRIGISCDDVDKSDTQQLLALGCPPPADAATALLPTGAVVHDVFAADLLWQPAALRVAVGDYVRFTFSSLHNVAQVANENATAYDGTGFHSGALGSVGASPFVVLMSHAGSYHYVCEPHAAAGMRGVVTVVDGDDDGSGAAAGAACVARGGAGCASCARAAGGSGAGCGGDGVGGATPTRCMGAYCVVDACAAGAGGCACTRDGACESAADSCTGVGGATARCVPAALVAAGGGGDADACEPGTAGCACVADGDGDACYGASDGDARCELALAVDAGARGIGLCVPPRPPCVYGAAGCPCTAARTCASAALLCVDVDGGAEPMCVYELAAAVTTAAAPGAGDGGVGGATTAMGVDGGPTPAPAPPGTLSSSTLAIIGGAAGGGALLLCVAVAVVALCCCTARRRRGAVARASVGGSGGARRRSSAMHGGEMTSSRRQRRSRPASSTYAGLGSTPGIGGDGGSDGSGTSVALRRPPPGAPPPPVPSMSLV